MDTLGQTGVVDVQKVAHPMAAARQSGHREKQEMTPAMRPCVSVLESRYIMLGPVVRAKSRASTEKAANR